MKYQLNNNNEIVGIFFDKDTDIVLDTNINFGLDKFENGMVIKADIEKVVEKRIKEREVQALCIESQSLKSELQKIKEDVEQVELFGMERADYNIKKARCKDIITRLREIKQK